ncbi:hypothetical protein [Salinimicrobium xinjiangense]|uniref:hypothetical protein n=1 Tax=Salinimicrobium xinjiangense TaxID=438596 RepID=UPI000408AA02|nr:hypothetical protein [Salinimicrobium xinjiangense]
MKKHLILLLLAVMFTFTSCSDDDDNTAENTIVGSWVLVSVNPPLIDLDCPQASTISFTATGTAVWNLYAGDNNCDLETSEGQWEKNSGNTYTIYIPNFQAVSGTVNFTGANSFTFTTNSVVLTFNKQI